VIVISHVIVPVASVVVVVAALAIVPVIVIIAVVSVIVGIVIVRVVHVLVLVILQANRKGYSIHLKYRKAIVLEMLPVLHRKIPMIQFSIVTMLQV
jgi:hypothetical protein